MDGESEEKGGEGGREGARDTFLHDVISALRLLDLFHPHLRVDAAIASSFPCNNLQVRTHDEGAQSREHVNSQTDMSQGPKRKLI